MGPARHLQKAARVELGQLGGGQQLRQQELGAPRAPTARAVARHADDEQEKDGAGGEDDEAESGDRRAHPAASRVAATSRSESSLTTAWSTASEPSSDQISRRTAPRSRPSRPAARAASINDASSTVASVMARPRCRVPSGWPTESSFERR